MISIGDVKWGNRIEPINVHELSTEELTHILEKQGIELGTNIAYPIDTRLVSVFRTDKQKLGEYIEACKSAFDRKAMGEKGFSIFGKNLQIHYELKHLKENETLSNEQKTAIYRQAKSTQALFKMFGSNNVKLEMSLLDRAYFEVQKFIQAIKQRSNAKALPAGEEQTLRLEQRLRAREREFREAIFSKEAQRATNEVSKTWQGNKVVEQPQKQSERV